MTLLAGNALTRMSQIPAESIDLVVTDPPYRNISGGTGSPGRPVGILSENDGKIFDHNSITASDYAPYLYRVLKEGSHCYVMTNLLNLRETWDAMRDAGFDLHNLLVWHKNTCTPNRWYMKNCEFTLFFRKGRARTINNPSSKMVHAFDNLTGPDKLHETQKPVELMRLYVENSSRPGDVVLDPFMGSGTTGEACMVTGRSFVGIEVDPKYMARACERLGTMPV